MKRHSHPAHIRTWGALLCAAATTAATGTGLAQPVPAPEPIPAPAPAEPPPSPAPAPAPAPVPASPAPDPARPGYPKGGPKPIAGWDKGFFIRSEDDKFFVRIGARAQTLFTYKIPAVPSDAKVGVLNEAQFSVPRARLTLDGNVFSQNLTYKLEIDFGKGLVNLKDAIFDYAVVPKWFDIRFGQWKVFFSRQNIASDFELQFVDRALTQSAFNLDREIGLAITNYYEKSPEFEYALGVFNGTGVAPAISGDVTVDLTTGKGPLANGKMTNVPKRAHPQIIARAGYNYGALKGYSEHDFDGGEPRFGIAASTMIDFQADPKAPSSVRGEADFIFKAYGFSGSAAVFVRSVQATDDGATTFSTTNFGNQKFDAVSFYVQGGYIIEDIVEPAFRYMRLAGPGNFDRLDEVTGAISVFFFKTNLQACIDGTGIRNESQQFTDWLLRTQLQGNF